MKIYLAGFIHGAKIEQCIAWRKRIREHYDNWKGKERYPVCWLDPLNGKDLASITKDGLHSSCPPQAIVHRDYSSVMQADLIVANMDMFGENRVPIGTISELAWAWDHRKPIILIANEKQFIEHPFLKYFASWIVKDVDELLSKKVINYMYKGFHSALY